MNKKYAIDYYIASGEVPHCRSLKVLTKDDMEDAKGFKKKWIRCKNFWFRKKFLWQGGIVMKAISKKYDVVIVNGDIHHFSSWFIASVRSILGRRIIMWTHGVLKQERGLKQWIRISFYRMADGLFLYGHRAKQILANSGMADNRLMVIYNSLDFDKQIAIMDSIDEASVEKKKIELGFHTEDQIIVTCGRLVSEKKVDYLIQVLPNLNNGRSVKLLVIGGGPDLAKLKNLATKMNESGNTVFFGDCYDERELALLMGIGDVFVLPGNAGLSVIHALTYGLPVITHDNLDVQKPEVEAIQEGVNGSFYRFGDLADLEKKISLWLHKAKDPQNRVENICQDIVKKIYNPSSQMSIINKYIYQEKNA